MKPHLYALFIILQVCLHSSAQVHFQSSTLPILIVDTQGQTIVDEPKVFSTLKIIDNGPGQTNAITDAANDYDGFAGIEIRGQSSQMFPKKNYGLELWTASGEDTSAVVLDLPREEDWVLHGPYSDKSLIRNYLSFYLWSRMGRYGSRTRLCELMINGDYQGVYVFMEKIKRDGDRVDISTLNPDENTGDDLTGGYILKIDKTNTGEPIRGWTSGFPPPHRRRDQQVIFLMIEEPDALAVTTQQVQYIRTFMDGFEQALAGTRFRDPRQGYSQFIQMESFVDYALLTEINRNVDGYRLSTFMHKDKDSKGGKLVMGPPWDYNLAFGNADYCEGGRTDGWAWDFNSICPDDHWLIPFWWKRLLQDGAYVSRFQHRWKELRAGPFGTQALLDHIDSVANVLEAPAQRNFQRWSVLGTYIWPNNFVGQTYEQEIDYLKTWITDRLEWMDTAVDGFTLPTGSAAAGEDITLYPNPSAERVNLTSKHPLIHAKLIDFQGKVLTNQPLEGVSQWVLSLTGLPAGIYVLRLQTADGHLTTRLILKE